MTCTLHRPEVRAVLEREHKAARLQREARMTAAPDGPRPRAGMSDFMRSDVYKSAYLAIGPGQGRFLYSVARARGARTIVEFGTSFGISTLYLAAAAADTGGRVTGSEYHAEKAEKAGRNLAEAGLAGHVVIRVGDARETLADLEGPIDLLFLDGAKDLYLPILRLLEPKLAPSATLVADNIDMLGDEKGGFLDYISDGNGRYVTTFPPMGGGGFSHSVLVA